MRQVGYISPLLLALAAAGCGGDKAGQGEAAALAAKGKSCTAPARVDRANPTAGMVLVKGGTFLMGANPERPEEGPPKQVTVGSFWIDPTEVTNSQFAAFVKATGYKTLAERPLDPKLYPGVPQDQLVPSSLVFTQPAGEVDLNNPSNWWRVVAGADWRHPTGPGSSIEGMDDYPVVHIAQQDAAAYAAWAGRALPTEAEWEYAARGGLDEQRFSWGNSAPEARSGNMWQGVFPVADQGLDGHKASAAPVGCYKPNGYGLYDTAGNVWEWTDTWYKPNVTVAGGKQVQPAEAESYDPDEPGIAKHVAKGGSFLCADNYCLRYRPSARTPGPPDTGSSHIGFRTIVRVAGGTPAPAKSVGQA